ncbi:hypothetical protein SAMN06298216_3344 [Spirosomataceae bacterium TFI 002]|nr:hypothetical protein SAMN06298216_3344 [Spirosomataceae bacterium TFI 002]
MQKAFKYLSIFACSILIILVILINWNLIKKPSTNEVYYQLQFLKEKRDRGEPSKMQKLFPEGLMFYESLYGITWAELLNESNNSKYTVEGQIELRKVSKAINSIQAKSTFQQNLTIPHGAFYSGWSTYFLSKKIKSDSSNVNEVENFKTRCEEISFAMTQSSSPYLESYQNLYWPADMVVCIAALANHDIIFKPKYFSQISEWISKVKSNLDKNGLIPHSANSDGLVLEPARGSSQSLILSFLPEIDSVFAKEQFLVYKKLFCEERLGLRAIREYPLGSEGNGDIDSGPVIWDIGTAATLVAQKAAFVNKDFDLSSDLFQGINALGFPYISNYQKNFLGGSLPIADAFIAWSRSRLEPSKFHNNVFWKFHLISILIVSLLTFAIYRFK